MQVVHDYDDEEVIAAAAVVGVMVHGGSHSFVYPYTYYILWLLGC
jgi:hypothetical protein